MTHNERVAPLVLSLHPRLLRFAHGASGPKRKLQGTYISGSCKGLKREARGTQADVIRDLARRCKGPNRKLQGTEAGNAKGIH